MYMERIVFFSFHDLLSEIPSSLFMLIRLRSNFMASLMSRFLRLDFLTSALGHG
jgi:hypothetical protein